MLALLYKWGVVMRIAIMGAGGIGAYYGACLARSGADVILIARGAHLDAMRKNGLRIQDFGGEEFTIDPVSATDDPETVGPVKAILFCVKMYDTLQAAALCKPLMGDDTIVVTLQNGVESVAMIDSVLGPGRALGGATFISATVIEPGLVRRNNQMDNIEFGETDGTISPRAEAFAKTLNDAGIESFVSPDVQAMLWAKFVQLTGNSGINALSRADTGVVRADPVMRAVYCDALRETVAVGRAMGVELPEDIIERAMNWLDRSAPIKASLAVDLESGRRLEVEWVDAKREPAGFEWNSPTGSDDSVSESLDAKSGGSERLNHSGGNSSR